MIEHEELESLNQWFSSAAGRYVRSWEQRYISRLVRQEFGYYAVQIGLPQWDFMRHNRVLHKWCTTQQDLGKPTNYAMVLCAAEYLPFANESIDLLVLPHTLETSSDPHQILREVQRVLVPEGTVVISGFNPWSLWSLADRVPGLEQRLPIQSSLHLSPWRVADWLELLSFEMTDQVFGGYGPLCQQRQWIRRWHFMEKVGAKMWPVFGGLYVFKAKKRVCKITMVGLDWSETRRGLMPNGAAVSKRQMSQTKQVVKHERSINLD